MRAMTGKDGPAGILTFLIADVRGYTSFTQAHGDEAAARLAGKFAEVTLEAIEAHGGELTELRGGEALCVFAAPRSALGLAARRCSRAPAGQIFVSQGVVHLARAVEGIQLEVEGDFELKGLSEPVRVFRAVADRA